MDYDLAKFRATFREEAAELIGELEEHLLVLERAPGDQERLDAIFRCAHSLKGGSGTFGFTEMARLTHTLEELLEKVRGREVLVDQPLINLLLRVVDCLRELLGRPTGESADLPLEELLEALLGVRGSESGSSAARPDPGPRTSPPDSGLYEIEFRPDPKIFERGIDPLQILRELNGVSELLEVIVDASALPPLTELDPERLYLTWTIRVRSGSREEIEEVFEFVGDGSVVSFISEALDPERQSEPRTSRSNPGAPNLETSTIRVAIEKVDRLIDLVGELVISQSMVSEIVSSPSPERLLKLREALDQMARHTRELQERVMAVRMVPVGSLFGRYPRLVRDLASRSGKSIALQISGEETELDKTVIDLMTDPLTHLIRNAADHGIETPEKRTTGGKPAQGIIRLSAFQESGRIVIEVADDGHGLDREGILRKAVAEGLVSEGAALSDEEVWALIFQPGFSTSAEVSEISGRGVGMDVVRKNVEALGGSISVMTHAGRGTRFTIRLPLTLAIMDGQCLQVGDQVFILPLVAITESIQPRQGDVRTVVGRGEVIHLRGDFIPVLRLHALFGIAPRTGEPTQGLLVIAESDGQKAALLADDLLGQQQVVLKSLETNFRRVEGIAATTILGDGRVALILDPPGLIKLLRKGNAHATLV